MDHHEEVITDIARREITRSLQAIAVNSNQISPSSSPRFGPRFGVMRAREFLMRMPHSFHVDGSQPCPRLSPHVRGVSLGAFYAHGLKFRAVRAASGSIGGATYQEFHVLADSGEDA